MRAKLKQYSSMNIISHLNTARETKSSIHIHKQNVIQNLYVII